MGDDEPPDQGHFVGNLTDCTSPELNFRRYAQICTRKPENDKPSNGKTERENLREKDPERLQFLIENTPCPFSRHVPTDDDWKEVDGMQINIGDAWKAVASAKINIGDAWKTITI